MKKLNILLLMLSCLFVISCSKGPGGVPTTCNEPKPLQPSFTQDKYTVHVGESVTFTYDGPTQPASVKIEWVYLPLDENSVDKGGSGEGLTYTATFKYTGPYVVWCTARNCNDDAPEMKKEPAVTVVP